MVRYMIWEGVKGGGALAWVPNDKSTMRLVQ
jgi:hypothetical protein